MEAGECSHRVAVKVVDIEKGKRDPRSKREKWCLLYCEGEF